MATPNRERALVSILRQLADERGIEMTALSYDWILRLRKGQVVRHVYGFNFELNSATAQLIADDKSAVADLLALAGVPHVEHKLVLHPKLAGYVPTDGNWTQIMAFARRHGLDVVCKPNDGTGGREVYRATSPAELELAVHRLLETNRAACISPFYAFQNEYRLIMLGGTCELAYAKDRPTVLGDGKATVLELILDAAKAGHIAATVAARAIRDNETHLADVPEAGEPLAVNWKHNLGQGSAPRDVDDPALLAKLTDLAGRCAATLNLTFASVDLADVAGRLLVLEVNAGIMMESYVHAAPDGWEKARRIYGRALEMMFAGSP